MPIVSRLLRKRSRTDAATGSPYEFAASSPTCSTIDSNWEKGLCGESLNAYAPDFATWVGTKCPHAPGSGGCKLAGDCNIPCQPVCVKIPGCAWVSNKCVVSP